MKAHLTKRLVCLILAIVLCLSAAVIPALAANDTKNVKVKVQKVSNDTVPTELNPERQAAAEDTVQTQSAEGPVRVSIVVKGGSVLDKYSTNGLTANYAAANYRQQVRASQNAVAREISADVLGGKKLDVVWNLTLAANIISANVESDQIDAIRALPDVEAVVVEQRYYPDRSAEKLATQPNMATSSSMIGTNVAYETGYTGAGTRIAVIDTGIAHLFRRICRCTTQAIQFRFQNACPMCQHFFPLLIGFNTLNDQIGFALVRNIDRFAGHLCKLRDLQIFIAQCRGCSDLHGITSCVFCP